MKAPLNDLERAYVVALRGPEGHPELFRQLRESILTFLMPYHPEMDGVIGVGNGDQVHFTIWQNKNGPQIPIFTSLECATDALKTIGAKENAYCVAEMLGKELFHLISTQEVPIVINPASGMGEFYMDLRGVKMLYDGSILKANGNSPPEPRWHGKMKIVDPADYPTDLLQPVFRFLKMRPEARAAWLFRKVIEDTPGRRYYIFAVKLTGNEEQFKDDFSIVIRESNNEKNDFGTLIFDGTFPAMEKAALKHPPFYAAPDYKTPSPLGEGE
jgi:hypothetical protein